jgi:hypothetical protein
VRSHYLRKIGSILGLCAILLTVFAPLISQSLRAHAALDYALASLCSAQDTGARLANVPGARSLGDPAGASSRDNPGHVHDDACAYCGFAAHFPALASAPAPAALPDAAVSAPPLSRRTAWRPADQGNWAQPRGPPAILEQI